MSNVIDAVELFDAVRLGVELEREAKRAPPVDHLAHNGALIAGWRPEAVAKLMLDLWPVDPRCPK